MADDFNNSIQRTITMVKGDTLSFGFQITGLNGIQPDEVYFSCKENIDDDEYIFSIDTSSGIELRSYDQGNDTLTYGVRLAPSYTDDVAVGRYFYDLKVEIDDDVLTLMKGTFAIEWEVKDL